MFRGAEVAPFFRTGPPLVWFVGVTCWPKNGPNTKKNLQQANYTEVRRQFGR